MNQGSIGKFCAAMASWRWRAIVRWFLVAAAFSLGSLGMLYVFVQLFRLPLAVATLLSAEIATVLRFFVTDFWVFDQSVSMAKGLWQFHCANAGGFVAWWCIANLLPRYGVPYMIAATLGIGGSTGVSLLTNFLWIWRKNAPSASRKAESPAPGWTAD